MKKNSFINKLFILLFILTSSLNSYSQKNVTVKSFIGKCINIVVFEGQLSYSFESKTGERKTFIQMKGQKVNLVIYDAQLNLKENYINKLFKVYYKETEDYLVESDEKSKFNKVIKFKLVN